MTGIADVPLIACQSGAMSDSVTSSLESFHLSSVDGTANPAYHSSASDSDRSASQDNDGEMELVSKRSTRRSKKSPGVYTSRITVNLSSPNAKNQVQHFNNQMDNPAAGNDMDLDSASGVIESGESIVDQHLARNMTDESNFESCDSAAIHQQVSKPIGAKLVVTSPALNQQNSVRVSTPLPLTCTSVMSNSTASSYSDSELIPQRNSVSHNVAEMVATEHLVTKRRPEIPQVFQPSSTEISGEQFLSLFQKTTTAEQRRRNQSVMERRIDQLHFQRSRSAEGAPASRRPRPGDAGARGLRTKGGIRSRHLNHTVPSQTQVPVLGSADLADITPESLLPASFGFHPLTVSSVDPVPVVSNSSDNSNAGNNVAFENSSTETATVQVSATEDIGHDHYNKEPDDGVFDEDSGNNTESGGSAVVIDVQSAEQSASTSASSASEHRVPNRAILRRGSGK